MHFFKTVRPIYHLSLWIQKLDRNNYCLLARAITALVLPIFLSFELILIKTPQVMLTLICDMSEFKKMSESLSLFSFCVVIAPFHLLIPIYPASIIADLFT